MKKPNVIQKAYKSLTELFSFTKDGQKKAIATLGGTGVSYFGRLQDPSKTGLKKPTKVTFNQLREAARYDAIIRICVNVIKKSVSQAEWAIIPKQERKEVNKAQVDQATNLFETINNRGENLRQVLDMVLEDLLVLDAGVIEKVYNAKGEIVELNAVDGATIRPKMDKYGDLDPTSAYVQVIGDKVVAEFALNELIYMVQSPQSDIRLYGYGMSPIESILLQVQAALNADLYNAEMFSKDNIPPGMLDLGDMSQSEAQQFISVWDATVVGSTQKLKFLWGGGEKNNKKYIPFNQNNKDMQFVEYTDWLSRIKLATYGLTGMDANITQDVNRATAGVQESVTSSRGVGSIFKLVEEYINREIFMPMGWDDIQFKFQKALNISEKKQQAEIDKIYVEAGILDPAEVAIREGFEIPEQDEEEIDYLAPAPEEKIEGKEDVLVPEEKKSHSHNFKPLYE